LSIEIPDENELQSGWVAHLNQLLERPADEVTARDILLALEPIVGPIVFSWGWHPSRRPIVFPCVCPPFEMRPSRTPAEEEAVVVPLVRKAVQQIIEHTVTEWEALQDPHAHPEVIDPDTLYWLLRHTKSYTNPSSLLFGKENLAAHLIRVAPSLFRDEIVAAVARLFFQFRKSLTNPRESFLNLLHLFKENPPSTSKSAEDVLDAIEAVIGWDLYNDEDSQSDDMPSTRTALVEVDSEMVRAIADVINSLSKMPSLQVARALSRLVHQLDREPVANPDIPPLLHDTMTQVLCKHPDPDNDCAAAINYLITISNTSERWRISSDHKLFAVLDDMNTKSPDKFLLAIQMWARGLLDMLTPYHEWFFPRVRDALIHEFKTSWPEDPLRPLRALCDLVETCPVFGDYLFHGQPSEFQEVVCEKIRALNSAGLYEKAPTILAALRGIDGADFVINEIEARVMDYLRAQYATDEPSTEDD